MFWLELLIIPKLRIVMKARFVTKTQKRHEFVKYAKYKTLHCYENGTIFIKKERPPTVWILDKK